MLTFARLEGLPIKKVGARRTGRSSKCECSLIGMLIKVVKQGILQRLQSVFYL
jgi:hypothetical protein